MNLDSVLEKDYSFLTVIVVIIFLIKNGNNVDYLTLYNILSKILQILDIITYLSTRLRFTHALFKLFDISSRIYPDIWDLLTYLRFPRVLVEIFKIYLRIYLNIWDFVKHSIVLSRKGRRTKIRREERRKTVDTAEGKSARNKKDNVYLEKVTAAK